MSNSQVDVHVQITYLKSAIQILNLLQNFKIFKSQTRLNKLLETWNQELAKMYGSFCSWPPLSGQSGAFQSAKWILLRETVLDQHLRRWHQTLVFGVFVRQWRIFFIFARPGALFDIQYPDVTSDPWIQYPCNFSGAQWLWCYRVRTECPQYFLFSLLQVMPHPNVWLSVAICVG